MKRFLTVGGLKTGSVATLYFAQRGPYVKIGISRDPARRVRDLRYDRGITPEDADRSQPISILHLIPGARLDDEFRMHARFDAWHVAGEWFRADPDFMAEVASLIAEGRAA